MSRRTLYTVIYTACSEKARIVLYWPHHAVLNAISLRIRVLNSQYALDSLQNTPVSLRANELLYKEALYKAQSLNLAVYSK